MNQLTILYLSHCPYCLSMKKAISELTAKNPSYRNVQITWIEESQQPALSNQYDYWYVPSIFSGDQKLFECHPSDNYETLKNAAENALKAVLSV